MIKEVDPNSECSAGFLQHLKIGSFNLCKLTSQKTKLLLSSSDFVKIHWGVYKCVPTPTHHVLCKHYVV